MRKTFLFLCALVLCLAARPALSAEESDLFSDKDLTLADPAQAVDIALTEGGVDITQPGVYRLSGQVADGSIRVSPATEGDVWLLLDGVSVHNEDGAALTSDGCDKLILTLAEGSVNTLTQGPATPTEEDNDAAIYVRGDLTMSGTYGYYTGIIFRGYTFGTGDAIVKGGRYDHLLEKFGKESPSIGFALVIDELMKALTRQHVRITYSRKNTLILYDRGMEKSAIELAKEFRDKFKNAELLCREPGKTLDDYIRYGKDYYAGSLIYIQADRQILMINLVTGEEKVVGSKEQEQ